MSRAWLPVCVWATAIVVTATPRAHPPASQGTPDRAAAVFTEACGKCHPVERVVAVRRTRLQWEEVMTTMTTARGAQVSDGDWDVILDFLVKAHGRVDVNRAPAEDLADVLEISEPMATSIVTYRKEHGPFKDLDALLKVPGVDGAQLKKKRDAIAF